MPNDALITTESGVPAIFSPEKAKLRDAQADLVIEYAKRVQDWPMLERAIEQKLEDQRLFIEWWETEITARHGAGRGNKNNSDPGCFSLSDAERLTGITQQQVSRWRARLQDPEKYKADLYGAAWARAMAAKRDGNADTLSVHFSSDSEEWYTPPEIIERTVKVLGEIQLDPCSNSGAKPNVPAASRYTQADDGLVQPWHGTVYMNPPYGRVIDAWVDKLILEYKSGRTMQAIALVPARVDTDWFRKFRDFAVCFIDGRLKFSGHQNSAPFPSAVVYLGGDIDRFHDSFSDLGDIWIRWQK